jgi:hypothetical protein
VICCLFSVDARRGAGGGTNLRPSGPRLAPPRLCKAPFTALLRSGWVDGRTCSARCGTRPAVVLPRACARAQEGLRRTADPARPSEVRYHSLFLPYLRIFKPRSHVDSQMEAISDGLTVQEPEPGPDVPAASAAHGTTSAGTGGEPAAGRRRSTWEAQELGDAFVCPITHVSVQSSTCQRVCCWRAGHPRWPCLCAGGPRGRRKGHHASVEPARRRDLATRARRDPRKPLVTRPRRPAAPPRRALPVLTYNPTHPPLPRRS